MRWFTVALASLLWIAPAVAQVQQAGQITPGHIGYWQHNNLLKDGGPALGGPAGTNPTEIGITATGTPFCITDGPVQPGTGYHQLCLGANTLNGYGLLSYNPYGGAAPLPFDCEINGVFIPNCFGGGGGSTGLTDVTGTFPITVTSPTSTTRNVAVGVANSVNLGVSRPDNTSITIDSNGILSVPPSPGSGCVVGTGTQFQVVVFDPASNCTASTIRDDGSVISATLNVGGGLPGDNVLKIDPVNDFTFIGDTAGDGNAASFSVVAIGQGAGVNNAGVQTVIIGPDGAGDTNQAAHSVILGDAAGFHYAGGTDVVLAGHTAGFNGAADFAVLIGSGPGQSSTLTENIIGIGTSALASTLRAGGPTTGAEIIALGDGAGANSTFNLDVVCLGDGACSSNTMSTSETDRIGIGTGAMSGSSAGSNSIGIGNGALGNNTGSNAVGIGNSAGFSNTLSDVVYLGRIGTATKLFINLVSAANCSGQPSKSIIATTGTGVLLQCP